MRQYIGARYVPKFMGTYDATQAYEALSVVDNGMGTDYISKIPTPAGTPLTNTTYWAIYGAYSGSIINLQDQINDMKDGTVPGSLQNQIDNIDDVEIPAIQSDIAALTKSWLSGKTLVILGDSLLTTRTRKTVQTYLEEKVSDITIINHAVGGTDMAAIAASVLTHSTDVASADVILINGGTNDWQNSTDLNTFGTSVYTAITNIISVNPTAKIIFMTSPYSYTTAMTDGVYNNNNGASLEIYNEVSKIKCKPFAVNILDTYHCTPCNSSTYTSFMEDDVAGFFLHPGEKLSEIIADMIINESYSNFIGLLPTHNVTSTVGTIGGNTRFMFDPQKALYCGTLLISLTSAVANGDVMASWDIGGGLATFGANFGSGQRFNAINYTQHKTCRLLITGSQIQNEDNSTFASGDYIAICI